MPVERSEFRQDGVCETSTTVDSPRVVHACSPRVECGELMPALVRKHTTRMYSLELSGRLVGAGTRATWTPVESSDTKRTMVK